MGKTIYAGLCAVVIGISAFGAFAQEAPVFFKAPAEGTVLEFLRENGNTLLFKVEKVDGQVVSLNGGNRYISFALQVGNTLSITDEEGAKIAAIFPLEVGKKVNSGHTFKNPQSGASFPQSDSIEVQKIEELSVPAGSFKTWLIRTDIYGNNYSAIRRCWFAPEVGFCAKDSFEDSRGAKWARELKSVKAP
ncbi:MAG: hypothetical protein HQL45_16435 [Alphaproteobacteria bacterium]|nr:hypothetical protein [Alphaproteobacteria bacterium]